MVKNCWASLADCFIFSIYEPSAGSWDESCLEMEFLLLTELMFRYDEPFCIRSLLEYLPAGPVANLMLLWEFAVV